MRLECLKLATQQGLKGEEAIQAASRMMQFAQEGDLATKRSRDKIETPKATIYRRPPNFDDYKPE